MAQFFYVGAQIMCWTFIIQYGTRIFVEQGMSEQAAEVLSQRYNIIAMALHCVSRFICTYLLKFFSPGKLLMTLAAGAAALIVGVIGFQGIWGLYCLVGVSACMCGMFSTIYGIALNGLGDDAKFGSAGLIMAILGGSVLPPLQGLIIDMGTVAGMPAENASFILPLVCFIVILVYGSRTYRIHEKKFAY
jgi:FHS family L-fucose permease-like MFS transporter